MIAGVGAAVGVVIVAGLRPLTGHLQAADATRTNPFRHLLRTASRPDHVRTFAVTVLLATGGFMLMPFGSTFTVNNMGIGIAHLPTIYLVTGICSIAAGPLLGRLADRVGKYAVFSAGSALGIVLVLILCTRGPSPLWVAIALNVPLFVSITARMIASQALISAVPGPAERGAFMAINSSIQQFSGGIAAALAGLIVVQAADGRLEHYDVLGVVVALAMAATVVLMRGIHVMIRDRRVAVAAPAEAPVAAAAP
jgi:predicted MFS family arabinose efflux permease